MVKRTANLYLECERCQTPEKFEAGSPREATAKARRHGWYVVGDRARCPNHAQEQK